MPVWLAVGHNCCSVDTFLSTVHVALCFVVSQSHYQICVYVWFLLKVVWLVLLDDRSMCYLPVISNFLTVLFINYVAFVCIESFYCFQFASFVGCRSCFVCDCCEYSVEKLQFRKCIYQAKILLYIIKASSCSDL